MILEEEEAKKEVVGEESKKDEESESYKFRGNHSYYFVHDYITIEPNLSEDQNEERW
jgi:hypothetical protein